jgi:16S rRNA (cytidine1402-2'-O)-methyltransferase
MLDFTCIFALKNCKLLYLLPCPIAENGLHTLPVQSIEITRKLDVFIVERAKTARHFVKSVVPLKPLPEMIFAEIPQEGGLGEAKDVFLAAIRAGKSVGLLSEAGCPGIADPGAALVALAHREGVRVVPVVGPSSLTLALMASGMNGQQFTFHGYLSPKRPELARDLKRLEQACFGVAHRPTQLFIETPYRSQMVLEVALETLHPATVFCVAQELTGVSEWICAQSIQQWKAKPPVALAKAPAVFLLGSW